MIAADGYLTVNGLLKASGGNGTINGSLPGGPGSGGAIRLASHSQVTIGSSGVLDVNPGAMGHEPFVSNSGLASSGRVRIESPAANPNIQGSVPAEVSIGDSTYPALRTQPPRLWIGSIGGNATPPADQVRGGLGTNGEPADMVLPQTGLVDIVVDSQNLPLNSLVYLRLGRARGHANELGPVVLTTGSSVTFTNVDLSAGYTALQARAVLPQP